MDEFKGILEGFSSTSEMIEKAKKWGEEHKKEMEEENRRKYIYYQDGSRRDITDESPQEKHKREVTEYMKGKANDYLSSIPSLYRDGKTEELENQEMVENILSGENAIILGGIGSGKTYALYTLCKVAQKRSLLEEARRYLHEEKERLTYNFSTYAKTITTLSLLSECRKGGSWTSEGIKRFGDIPFLCIDEIDKPYNKADVEVISELINYRYSNGMQTVVSGNGNERDFILKYGEWMESRLLSNGRIYTLTHPDRRREHKGDSSHSHKEEPSDSYREEER